MNLYFSLKRFITLFVALSFFGIQLAGSVAQASMVGTETILQSQQVQADRSGLAVLFDREDVRAQLVDMGVDVEVAKLRVSQLTESELASLNQHMADLPAGSEAVLGILLTIFIIFVITDVIGATDIFPFIHPVR